MSNSLTKASIHPTFGCFPASAVISVDVTGADPNVVRDILRNDTAQVSEDLIWLGDGKLTLGKAVVGKVEEQKRRHGAPCGVAGEDYVRKLVVRCQLSSNLLCQIRQQRFCTRKKPPVRICPERKTLILSVSRTPSLGQWKCYQDLACILRFGIHVDHVIRRTRRSPDGHDQRVPRFEFPHGHGFCRSRHGRGAAHDGDQVRSRLREGVVYEAGALARGV